MLRWISLITLIYLSLAFSCRAEMSSVSASVDRNVTYDDEPITLSLSIENGDGSEQIHLPEIPELSITYYGQSSQTSIINGKATHSIGTNYLVKPLKTGKFTILPIQVTSGGKTFRTKPITLEILPSKNRPQSRRVSSNGAVVESDEILVELKADKKELVVDEPTVIRFRILKKPDTALRSAGYDPPSFTNFVAEKQGTPTETAENRNGVVYEVTELRTVIYPTQAGTFEIGPYHFSGQVLKQRQRQTKRSRSPFGFDDFFSDSMEDFMFGGNMALVPVKLSTDTVTIKVNPIPEQGKPPSFSGTVGNYTLKVEYSDLSHVKKGDPVTLTMTIAGAGHIKTIAEPKLNNLDGFKAFESETTFASLDSEGPSGVTMAGKKIFKKMLVPERAGTLKLPTIQFDFYNPVTREYQTLIEPEKAISVEDVQSTDTTAGKVFSGSAAIPKHPKESLKMTAYDIIFINTDPSILRRESAYSWRDLASTLVAGILIYGFSWFFVSRRRRLICDPGYARKRIALKRFRSGMRSPHLHKKKPDKESFHHLNSIFTGYISDKLNLPPGVLTVSVVDEKIAPLGLSNEEILSLKNIFDQLDMGQYGLITADKSQWKELTKKIETVISNLEKIA
ncbi:MAG: protein BatD [Candidatus Aureabacteria bacterium]|nr:protein BatD [Candidatus Auribacterota bacterium]